MAKPPIAVWIPQVLLAIVLVASVGLTIYVCRQIVAAGMRPGIPRSAIVLYGVKAPTWNCLFLFLFGLAFWGLCQARSYGRWLGLAFVLLFWGTSLYTSIHPVKGPIPTFSIDYSNPSELTGAVLGPYSLTRGFLILVLKLAFGKSSKLFFRRAPARSTSDRDER